MATSLCGDYDLAVAVPEAAPDVQDRYLYEHLRGHLIGRDPGLPPLRVYVEGHLGKTTMLPPGVDVAFRSQWAPRPHRVKVVGDGSRPPVRCVHCGKQGAYIGQLDTVDMIDWENGVRGYREVVQMPDLFDATSHNVMWETA